MPLRYITQIGDDLVIRVPQAIMDYRFGEKEYVCEIIRCWSSDRTKQVMINENTTLCRWDYKIHLHQNTVSQKYGFVKGDHLEILFRKLRRKTQDAGLIGREKWEEQDLFPERQIDELLFDPDD